MKPKSKLLKPKKYVGLLSQSVLNGVVGDYLEQTNNALAIQMGLYHRFNKVNLETNLEGQLADIPITNRVVVLVHGLTNLETIWNFNSAFSDSSDLDSSDLDSSALDKPIEGKETETNSLLVNENYGSKLHRDFGFTPLFVRYNTGLSVESNGRQLSRLLEDLNEHYPMRIDELVLIGFSMGGLLLRSAQNDAIEKEKTWLSALSKCIYIGTPHEGSPLEKFGYITSELVRNVPLEYVNHWAQWIDVRSQGIKDLKLGLKLMLKKQETRECESFYSESKHYFISGSIGRSDTSISGKVLGDSLVRKGSAVPSSKPIDSHYAHFNNLPHIPLAHSENVYQQIADWFSESPSQVSLKYLDKNSDALNTDQNIKPTGPSSQAVLSGAVSVLSDTANKVVDTTEVMQRSISAVPYGILKRIPVVEKFSRPVERVHSGVSDLVFDTLKRSAKKAKDVSNKTKR